MMPDDTSSIREQNFKDEKIAREINSIEDIFIYGSLVLTTVMLGVCLFWEFYPYHIITIKNVKMSSSVVYQGTMTTYENDYVKTASHIEANATRKFVNGLIFDAGSYTSNLPVGSGHVVRNLPIPVMLPPGRYHVTITLRYRVNPIRVVEVIFNTDEFTVLAAKSKSGVSGDKGNTGIQGPKGDTGATGLQGPKGNTGKIGLTGALEKRER